MMTWVLLILFQVFIGISGTIFIIAWLLGKVLAFYRSHRIKRSESIKPAEINRPPA